MTKKKINVYGIKYHDDYHLITYPTSKEQEALEEFKKAVDSFITAQQNIINQPSWEVENILQGKTYDDGVYLYTGYVDDLESFDELELENEIVILGNGVGIEYRACYYMLRDLYDTMSQLSTDDELDKYYISECMNKCIDESGEHGSNNLATDITAHLKLAFYGFNYEQREQDEIDYIIDKIEYLQCNLEIMMIVNLYDEIRSQLKNNREDISDSFYKKALQIFEW